MRIIVLMKAIADTYAERTLDLETGLADRTSSEPVLDEIGERALELALTYADAHEGTEVTVLSMAPEAATATIRKALAIGAHSAVQIVGDELRGADLGLTAEVLAAGLDRLGFDLVVAGNLSADGVAGVLPAMLAEHLGVPQLTTLSSVEIGVGEVSGVRVSDAGAMTVWASLPAVISVTEALPDARFPSFKGIMAAKKKPIDTLSPAQLGIVADDPGTARTIMTAITRTPPRQAGTKIVDEGDGGEQLARFLLESRLA